MVAAVKWCLQIAKWHRNIEKRKKHSHTRLKDVAYICVSCAVTTYVRIYFDCSPSVVLLFEFSRSFARLILSRRSHNLVLFTGRAVRANRNREIERATEKPRYYFKYGFSLRLLFEPFVFLRFVPISAPIWQSYSLLSRHETIFQFRKIYNCCARNTRQVNTYQLSNR